MAADTTKKTKLTIAELQAMSVDERQKLLAEKRQTLSQTRVTHKAGELMNPRKLTELRRDIARIMTVENSKPVVDEEAK